MSGNGHTKPTSRCKMLRKPHQSSCDISEGESERDGSFFSIGDVAPHGSAGRLSESVVYNCGYSLIVCMVVVGGVNIVRSVLVCISSLEGFHSGFPLALMLSGIHIAGEWERPYKWHEVGPEWACDKLRRETG
ncbi:hypothetical protein MRX96_010979 [Rhipicephalus microplus]